MTSYVTCFFLVIQIIMCYGPVQSSNGFPKTQGPSLSKEWMPKPEKLSRSLDLEEVVKTNSDAYTIWNITNKYNTYDPNNTKPSCIWQLSRNDELIPLYMLNITLNNTETFLEDYMIKEFKHYTGNELTYARVLHENREGVIDDMEKYFSIYKNISRHEGKYKSAFRNNTRFVGKYHDEDKGLICLLVSQCGCVQSSYLDTFEVELEVFKHHTQHLWEFIVFGTYVDPFFRIIAVLVGLILNYALLHIFYKEDIVRSESNILILNMAISNVLMLILYIPTNYLGTYHLQEYDNDSNRGIRAIQSLVVSANTVTILFINIQRYFDVSRVLNPDQVKCKLTPTWRCITYLAVLWAWCLLISLVFGLFNPYEAQLLEIIVYFFIYLFAFSIVLAVFNSMTARKLQHSAEHGNTVSDLKHIAGSGVVLSLTATFYVTHFSFFLFNIYESLVDWMYMDFYNSSATRVIIFIFHVMFLLYPCVNVLVLYKASSTYRYFLKEYLFRCWHNPQERQYLTMASVQSSE